MEIFTYGSVGGRRVIAASIRKKTHTALRSFSRLLSHNGLQVSQVLLPVVRARCGLLNAGVMMREMSKEIEKGLLLDSGDTLVRPKQGRWWPPPYFHRIVTEHGFEHLDWGRIDQAVQEGMKYLDAHHNVQDEIEERAQFRAYFEIVLHALGLPDPPDELTEHLGNASVDELEMEPFPETRRTLEHFIGKGMRLGILSNAWPSLEKKYAKLGLRDFFQVFVISSRVGCCKPNERIFRTAIQRMALPTERIMFVDDFPPYVRKAIEIGMRGVVIARHGKEDTVGLECVESLAQLVDLINGTAS